MPRGLLGRCCREPRGPVLSRWAGAEQVGRGRVICWDRAPRGPVLPRAAWAVGPGPRDLLGSCAAWAGTAASRVGRRAGAA